MPLYDFRDNTSGEIVERLVKYADLDQFALDNPNLEKMVSAPMIVGGVDGLRKTDGGFNEVISKIAARNPDTPLGREVNSRSAKEVKTQAAVDKWKSKAGVTGYNLT
jgi:hypothetical protein|tara:strand:- start:5387 stop:5707 length:321 start_codon:yes stop_codon:yes gene_type:complete